MVLNALIGLGAGIAAALLFASVASGSLLSIFLFYLSALPILIAALGWSHWSALIAAIAAAVGLTAVFGAFFFFAFLFGVGLPAWWLGYLALLARPAAAPESGGFEWYPPGHLVMWAALLGAFAIVAAIPHLGADEESFNAALKSGFERIIRLQTRTPTDVPLELPGLADPKRVIDFLVMAVPPAAAVLTTIVHILNLWLAGRIVKVSGRLKRSWPDIPAMVFPSYAPALLAISIAGTFLPGLAGIVGGIMSASLLMAYAVLGFAVLHAVSRNMAGRSFILAGAYALVLVLGWPVLAMMLLGLIDSILGIRRRSGIKRGPPAANHS